MRNLLATLPILVLLVSFASAQGIITTVAGGGPNNVPALEANLAFPHSVAVDSGGNLYVAAEHRVFKVDNLGMLTVVAGTGRPGFTGDGGPATAAGLALATGIALDANGNLFIADMGNRRIRRVDAVTGVIGTVAGNGSGCFSNICGEGGLAINARLTPWRVAVDAGGNLFFTDRFRNRLLRVDAASGTINTVAGGGAGGDGVPAVNALLQSPNGIAVDSSGNLFIAESDGRRIRRVDASTGIITTVTGNGQNCQVITDPCGDGGPASGAKLSFPQDIAMDRNGNLFIADQGNVRIRRIDASTGVITTVAGSGAAGFSGDGGPATSAKLVPVSVTVDNNGNLFIADPVSQRIRRVDAATRIITTAAGNGMSRFSGEGVPATSASLAWPRAMAIDGSGNLFIADSDNQRIRRVDASTGMITTVAGGGSSSGDGGPATAAYLGSPSAVAVDGADNLIIAAPSAHRIRRVDAVTGTITTIAGNGGLGFGGDGGTATNARLAYPSGVAVDGAGNVFIADLENDRVRRVDAFTGIISTVAGNGLRGFSGDGGPAASASLARPSDLEVDEDGDLYIIDDGNLRIRRVDAATGIITTVAGGGACFCDGGAATSARLSRPQGIGLDGGGNLFIADTFDQRIRRVDTATGVITTVAGTGTFGFKGDGGPAGSARLAEPFGVAVDASGHLLIVDFANLRIRRVDGVAVPKKSSTAAVVSSIFPRPNSANWNNTDVIVTLRVDGGSGGPTTITYSAAGAQPIASTTVTGSPAQIPINAEGETAISFFANSANAESQTITVRLDKTRPVVTCGSADGLWHATDVNIECTSVDGISGLAVSSDSSFQLRTNVLTGNETPSASTDSRIVCDLAGNCATAGPIAGNRIDRKPPQITVASPQNTIYVLNQAVHSSFECNDGGSGLASCSGLVDHGAKVDVASVGNKTFSVTAADLVGNSATQSVAYKVTYQVAPLYDPSQSRHSGSTFPIKLQLRDANGVNFSSAERVATAVGIVMVSSHASAPLSDTGNANPDNNFRFDSNLGDTGGYIFNLSTQGFATGTYDLNFRVDGDPVVHSVQFQVK